jgi:hypothetical protein
MSDPSLFNWRHFQADIILCAVRWYLRYALSYESIQIWGQPHISARIPASLAYHPSWRTAP